MSTSDDEVCKGIREELGDDFSVPDPNYQSLAEVDPDALWRRAKEREKYRRRTSKDSWRLVFRAWLWVQAIPLALFTCIVLFGWVGRLSEWVEAYFGSALIVVLWALGTLVLWLPTLVVHRKDRINKWAITLLNVFLFGSMVVCLLIALVLAEGLVIAIVWAKGWVGVMGWCVGWVIAMVWAVSDDGRTK